MFETASDSQSFRRRKPFDNTKSALLFTLTDDGSIYLIPSSVIGNRAGLSLGKKYEQYRSGGGRRIRTSVG